MRNRRIRDPYVRWCERDQFGNRLQIPLLKGTYKVREHNPTRDDGTRILYCPLEHVASEMNNLVGIYNDLVDRNQIKVNNPLLNQRL